MSGHTSALIKIIERSKRDKETWRYTDIEKLLAKHDTKAIAPLKALDGIDAKAAVSIVFRDGVWKETESVFGDIPATILRGDAHSGYRLVLAEQTCLVAQPIEILFQNTSSAANETPVNLSVEVGASGRLTLLERHEGVAHAVCMNVTIALAKQAKFLHGRIITQQGAQLGRTQVTLEEGAYYDNFTLLIGNALTRNEIDVTMQGEQAQVSLNGVMLLDDDHHSDTRICVTHAAPFGVSQQFYKILAGGKSRGIFQGKVIVAEGAQKTDSQQLCRSLLLSDQAEVDARPELEIYADDVKCTHGATVGDLDAEALFYMRARGIPEYEARALLMRAFAEDVIDHIHVPEWQALCHAVIERWFHDRRD